MSRRSKIVVSHPTGNQNVRQVLKTLSETNLLECFCTTISWRSSKLLRTLLPDSLHQELNRRCYWPIPEDKILTTPIRESLRLLVGRTGLPQWKSLSILEIAKTLDRVTASQIRIRRPNAVYAYEGMALQTFKEAKRQGVHCIYELPSAYWHYEIDLLREEADLQPEYADTILKLKDPMDHILRKDEELGLADRIIVPSSHVARSLGASSIATEILTVLPYGANESPAPLRAHGRSKGQRLKVLYVGALTQRKGISYALDAISQLQGKVDLTLIGSRVGKSKPIDQALSRHRWLPTLPHYRVLDEMANHDVLLLPSLTEGFALVISEALSRGLPVITTKHSGAEDIIRDGIEGFLIPIRSSAAIAEKITLLDSDRVTLEGMASAAKNRASHFGWSRYRSLLLSAIREVVH